MKGTTPEKVKALNAPTPPEKVQWRGDRTTYDNSRINVLGYIDARFVMEALDTIVGPENWQDRYEDIPNGTRGGIGIFVNDEWVWKWDAAPHSDIESVKGGHSDALKRAGVKWGIGRDLYDLPDIWVPAEETRPNSGKYRPAHLPTWNGSEWVTDRGTTVSKPPAAPQRPVAVPAASTPTADPDPYEDLPFEGDEPVRFPPIGSTQPKVNDPCPIHDGEVWRGTPGDLWHGPKGVTPDGYCRPAGQPKKARAR